MNYEKKRVQEDSKMCDLNHWADQNAVTETVQRRAGGGNQRDDRNGCGRNQDIVFRHEFGDAQWTLEMPNRQLDMSLDFRVQG